ncbi:MAG: hypothetical protein SO203_05765 [Eubacteriales bacterium]|nr:hypothetical protein [Christensenellaceae bacterium]MDD7092271.1 hypothetical protein [Christensenellaceae bacterium]MDD7245774.1 hypothetical protein [Christensenellaceae bacterium]MDY4710066.1 hypothetical protein [Eubacteriales bacterium]
MLLSNLRRLKMSNRIIKTGEKPGAGCYSCTNCHTKVCLDSKDKMPPCPKCTNNEFTKE